MTPATQATLRSTCTPEGRAPLAHVRSIPCDVAQAHPRSAADLDRLRAYALALDADVIALQEVDGADAARLIFPGHDFCFTRRIAVQNNGFAVKRGQGIRFACGPDLKQLSLGHEQLRWGAELRILSLATELRILNVHLKSGCAERPLSAPDESCKLLAQQIAPLRRWAQTQAQAHVNFMIVGDFNRRLSQERGWTLWNQLNGADSDAQLVDANQGRPYTKCRLSAPHRSAIDHILGGRGAAAHWNVRSFKRLAFSESDAARFQLSDHCPISIDYR